MINNPKGLDTYVCSKPVSKYLLERNLPLLGAENGKYYFANTELLKEVLEFMPFWLKLMDKILR